jgi:two-component system chemotaxis sensor kinase CheA
MSLDPSRYADLFRTESREQLSAINRALLLLEEGGDHGEPVSVVFRAVHTVKGMSATMGYHAVAEFAHELESVLDRVRRGDQLLAPDLMDALFASADALETAIDDASEQAGQTPAMIAALQRLRDVAGGSATSEFPAVALAASGALVEVASADPLDGEGVIVRVRQAPDAMLPGVRAFMAVQRVRGLGEVAAVHPAVEVLQASVEPMSFAMRVVTSASVDEIEEAVRSAGDIAFVEVDVSGRTRRESRSTIEVVVEGGDVPGPVTAQAARPTRHVRVDLARLDALMNLIGELVITRGRLLQLTASNPDPALDESMQMAARLVSDLQTEIMTMRMVPVWQVFDRFPRLVRDAARQQNKDVNFVVEGKEIELDRSLLDEIGEAIVHLLRNAIGHGFESPQARLAAGKPRSGRLVLSAARDRAAVLIRVSDDGRGIDRARVLARARALGLVDDAARELDDDALFRVIATPGFSTADQISDLSGRGVGIDAVQTKARALGGSVELKTVAGEGTSITIRLPVTLAIVRALLARSGTERYALPLTHVLETLEYDRDVVQYVKGKPVLVLRDEVLPLLDLRDVVRQRADTFGDGVNREIVVIERGERRSGLVVDELIGQQDIVVKQFDAAREGLALFSGATILADGAPALIMDVGSLFEGN